LVVVVVVVVLWIKLVSGIGGSAASRGLG